VLAHLGERTRPAARNRRPSGARFAGVAVSASVVADDTSRGRTDMGKIVISENVSLDGVIQDPTGEEGFRHGGWFSQIGDKDREAWAKVEFEGGAGRRGAAAGCTEL
jgi:hypothetical protein